MKVKVSELKDDALDWAAAKCAGRTLRHMPMGPQGGHGWWVWEETPSGKGGILIDKSIYMPVGPRRVPKTRPGQDRWSPSTDWAQGGPIGDRERINVTLVDNGPDIWAASLGDPWRTLQSVYSVTGPTRLVAMMRCFVASKLGDEIEIPEALTVNR